MRVIGGSAKGRTLFAPGGAATRPTSDLVRGAVFNMLEAAGVNLSAVLDLYAGSGALGIEALSRGAATCDFVERDPKACAAIRRNLRAIGFEERTRTLCMPVGRALDRLTGPYTLVLADPPYADAEALAALARCAAGSRVAGDGVLVFEHASRVQAPEAIDTLRLLRERRHGDTTVTLYRRDAERPPRGEASAMTPGEGEMP